MDDRRRKVVQIALNMTISYQRDLFTGIAEYATACGRWQMVGDLPAYRDPDQVASPSLQHEPDGVIGFITDAGWVEDKLGRNTPVVTTSASCQDTPLVQPVVTDNIAVGRLAAEHLMSKGLTRFAFHSTSGGRRFVAIREVGFTSALERAGHALDHRWVTSDVGARYEAEQVANWLKRLPKPIGVMAVADEQGWFMLSIARNLGIRVPEELAVIAVNDDPIATQISTPPMSSIGLNMRVAGRRAAQVLDELMQGTRTIGQPIYVPPETVTERESSRIHITPDSLVTNALTYIRDHADQPIGVDDVVARIGISRRNLENRFRAAVGYTPHTAIMRAHIDRAQHLLSTTDLSIAQVADAAGFGNARHFSVAFRKATGRTPSDFREHPAPLNFE